MPVPRRRLLTIAAGGVLTAILALGSATAAQAHNYLVSSTPAIGSTISALPQQFEVTTNENLLNLGGQGNGFFLEVKGPDGLYYGDGCVTVSGPSIRMPAALGPAGAYTVLWQVVSEDGHTTSSEFGFTWRPGAGAQTSSGSRSVPDCHGTVSAGAGNATAPSGSPVAIKPGGSEIAVLLWVGGGVLAVVAAVAAALLVLSRNKGKRGDDATPPVE